MSDVRKQVMAQIIDVMAKAEAAGQDPYDAAQRAFPGTPEGVLLEAHVEVMCEAEEAWWLKIERTIDAEVIRVAISGPADKAVPAGSRDAHLDEAFAALTEADVAERRCR